MIGDSGKLPWKIKEDMEFFKKTTTGNAVIMGRKTYESIGKPLEHRKNIIISKTLPKGYLQDGVIVFDEFDMETIQKNSLRWDYFIIGGKQIYEESLQKSIPEKLLISRIKGSYSGDTYFPNIPENYELKETFILSENVFVEEWKRC